MTDYPVFSSISPYGFVHHRALNSHQAINAAAALVLEYPNVRHVFEGDVCWNFQNGREDLYFRHPHYVVDTLGPVEFDRQRAAGEIFTIEDLIEMAPDGVHFIIELKVGRGSKMRAIRRLCELLQQNLKNRFWIDAFSPRLLRMVKKVDQSIPTSLHTERVSNGHVWIDAVEFPPIRWCALSKLKGVDAISIRKRFGTEFMREACASVQAAGFQLILSRLKTMADYEFSREASAIAGYPKVPIHDIFEKTDENSDKHNSP